LFSLDLITVGDPPSQQSLTDEAARDTAGRLGRVAVGVAGSIIAALIVLLFITYVATWFQKPSTRIVGSIERWVYFIGNVVVACYCFPAFRASRRRAFLYLAFAALGFAYGALFTLLFGPRLPAESSRSQLVLYYGLQRLIQTVGLILYTVGVVSLARDAQRRAMRSNQSLQPTAGHSNE
jgi:hypothetical protein